MIELEKETERVILVGVCTCEQEDTLKSLEELEDLADTAGGFCRTGNRYTLGLI